MFNSRGLDSMLLDIPRIRASATCIGHLSPMKSLTSFTRPPSPSCKPPVPRDDEPRMNMDEICITPLFFIHRLRRPKVSLPYIYIYIPSPIVATILYSLLVAVDRLEKDLFLQWRPQASSPRQAATIRLRLWRDAQSVVVGYRLIRLADIAFDSPVSIDRSLPEEIMHPRERNVSLFLLPFLFIFFALRARRKNEAEDIL